MSDPAQQGSNDLPFEFRPLPVSAELQQQHWKNIEAALESEPFTVFRQRRWLPFAVAAFSIAVVAFAIWYFGMADHVKQEYRTGFAQIKNITLPDGSIVVLNANSTLKIPSNWNAEADRQVWLDGEAFFQVEKKPATLQKFIVHAKDLDVSVLGTRFNVNTRHEQSTVALEEGKVLLTAKGQLQQILQSSKGKSVIEMTPGLVVAASKNGIAIHEEKEVILHSGWVRNEWHFNNTRLDEIATMIEDVYGYHLQINDDDLKQRTITGDLRAANIQELVNVLEVAFKLNMTIEKKTIQISLP